ncbi:hypothetical protein F5Y15DRAFT_349075 [Xylariaceae sp. FL0016]|nr:hypothetical protein F5Y15DRAFT_349075 [Xylariaceae sp. FL0016]
MSEGVLSQSRHAAIHSFITKEPLTSSEARFVRILLADIRTDFLCDLPVELVNNIARHFEFRDFATCLSVSKGWRNKLLSDLVMTTYAKIMWPSLATGNATPLEFLHVMKKVAWAGGSWGTLSRRKEKALGPKTKCVLLPLFHDFFQPDHEFTPVLDGNILGESHDRYRAHRWPQAYPLYSHGKLAWRPKENILMVGDLRSVERKCFGPPHGLLAGPEIQLRAFGSRLLVGTIGSTVIAWDHIKHDHRETRIHGPIRRCLTEGFKIAIVLFSGHILLWEYGGKLVEITTDLWKGSTSLGASPCDDWRSNLHVFFGAQNNETIFVSSVCTCKGNFMIYQLDGQTLAGTFIYRSGGSTPIEATIDIDRISIGRDIIRLRCIDTGLPEPTTGGVLFDIHDREFIHQDGAFRWLARGRARDIDFIYMLCGDHVKVGYLQPWESLDHFASEEYDSEDEYV